MEEIKVFQHSFVPFEFTKTFYLVSSEKSNSFCGCEGGEGGFRILYSFCSLIPALGSDVQSAQVLSEVIPKLLVLQGQFYRSFQEAELVPAVV